MSDSKKETSSYRIDEGDTSKEVYIREVENGWIVRIEKSWREKEEYECETKEYISSKDPREIIKDTPIGEDIDDTRKIISAFNSMF